MARRERRLTARRTSVGTAATDGVQEREPQKSRKDFPLTDTVALV
jgi:hypothetical protein